MFYAVDARVSGDKFLKSLHALVEDQHTLSLDLPGCHDGTVRNVCIENSIFYGLMYWAWTIEDALEGMEPVLYA